MTYAASPASKLYLAQTDFTRTSNGKTTLVKAPIEEFDLLKVSLNGNDEEELKEGLRGPSVFLVTKGKVVITPGAGDVGKEEELKEGQAVFVMPGKGWKMKALQGEAEVWGAFVEA